MLFKVAIFQPTPSDPKASLSNPKKKAVEPKPPRDDGIEVTRFMWHPTCPFCGLQDRGKESPERPNEKHMLLCKDRCLTPKPFTEIELFDFYGFPTGKTERKERTGSFIGEMAPISLRIPVRQIIKVKVKVIEDGVDTGRVEEKFMCTYRWKVVNTYDWWWDGKAWQPWYAKNKKVDEIPTPKAELTKQETGWLAAFVRS